MTLKLLDSEGNNVKDSAMKDIDIDTPTIDGTNYNVDEKLYANTYKKDKLCVIRGDNQTNVRVTDVVVDTANNAFKVETESSNTPEDGDRIVNLTNQIEYVFEIKTQEYDPMNTVRPTIDS